MFTLRHQTNYSAPNNLSFYSLNKAEMTDTEMDAITDDIVNGLFAVCVTLGKDLWRNGRNTPKNCIFWKYIVGGKESTLL